MKHWLQSPNCFLLISLALEIVPLVFTILHRVAHDRLVADFEALECIRVRRQQRQQFGAVKDHLDDISGALAAEEAMERYMSKMPAAEQAREKVKVQTPQILGQELGILRLSEKQ